MPIKSGPLSVPRVVMKHFPFHVSFYSTLHCSDHCIEYHTISFFLYFSLPVARPDFATKKWIPIPTKNGWEWDSVQPAHRTLRVPSTPYGITWRRYFVIIDMAVFNASRPSPRKTEDFLVFYDKDRALYCPACSVTLAPPPSKQIVRYGSNKPIKSKLTFLQSINQPKDLQWKSTLDWLI